MSVSGARVGPAVLDRDGPNALAVMNAIVGDEWTLWILQTALTAGLRQYKEWMAAGPISSSVLTTRLARLVDVEVMERVEYSSRPPRYEYRLTGSGRQMWPILLTMWAWELRWAGGSDVRPPRVRHTLCGRVFSPHLVCDACNQAADASTVSVRIGPSGAAARSVPAASTRRRAHGGTRPAETLSQAMELLGNRWSAALLGALFLGAHRFGEFEQRMGAPPTIVADRVRTFCELGVVESRPNPQRPDWLVYHLTEKGRDIYPFVVTSTDWAQRWFQAPEGPAVRLTHDPCGRAFRPRLACGRCGARLRGAHVQVVR